MQITQFLVGSTFAAIHLFLSYTVPVSVPYKLAEKLAPVVNASSISSAVSSAAETAMPAVTGVAVAFLRRMVYRAAGDEGLAENIAVPGSPVPVHQDQHVLGSNAGKTAQQTIDRTVFRTEYQSVPCIDTSGQAFAVYLNLIYLAPLTILFMRFFFKSYLRRTSPNTKHQTKHTAITKATRDAAHGVERELESLGQTAENGISTALKKSSELRGRKVNGSVKNGEPRGSMSPAAKEFGENVLRKANARLQELDEVVANGNGNGHVETDSQPGTPQSKKAKQRAAKKAREQQEKDEN